MRRALIVTLFLAAAAFALTPAAEAGPFYFVGKLGSTNTDLDVEEGFSNVLDGDDNSASFGIGFKTGRNMAFQLEYYDLGKVAGFGSACPPGDPACITLAVPIEVESSAISLTILPSLLLTRTIRIYGKLGYLSWDADISTVGDLSGALLTNASDEEVIYGAGLRLEIPGPIGAFAEYERIADAFDTVAIGATWGF